MTGPRRTLWWTVLVGGALLVVTAVVLAVGTRPPADFGESAVERRADASASTSPAPTPAPYDVRGTTAPQRPGTVPVVPAEARRAARATAEQPVAPVRLRIPTLDVGADVVPVGVDDEGLMEIPASGQEVGWYRFGPAPGATAGSTVLASHVNTRAEGDGVLARLGDLREGDTVVVTLQDGTEVDYTVTGRRTVDKTELDGGALFDRAGPARLAIVTCGGPWQEERSSYRDNVVVLAEPVLPPRD
jgi:sortase (surface protein transpeptidase)